MAEAKPFAVHNALEAVGFIVQLKNHFSAQDVEALFSLKERLAEELPSFEKMTTHMLGVVGNSLPQQESRDSGVILQSFKSNGRQDWVLRAMHNQILVTCSDYTRWVDVSAKAIRLIYTVMQSIRAEVNPVQLVAMQFLDKFLYDGVPDNYNTEDIFRSDTEYLTPFSRQAGNQWHVYQGWFVDESETVALGKGRVLNGLNIATSILPDRNLTTTIEHLVQFASESEEGIFFTSADKLNTHFTFLHEQNKYILLRTLSDKQLQKIGLSK